MRLETRMTTASILPAAGLASAIDRILGSALAKGRVAGAVALVAKDGELVYARATGFADLDNFAIRQQHDIAGFARAVRDRRGRNIAAVAVANKLARQAWAELRQAA